MFRPRTLITFLLPALLLYLGFLVIPAFQAFQLSFQESSGFGDTARWVGAGNYLRMLGDPLFWASLSRMLIILFVGGAAVFALAFFFTLLMNSGVRGRKIFRALIFLPNVIAVTAITTVWSFVFMPRYGLLTHLLRSIGLEGLAGIAWTAPGNVFWAMLVGLVWLSAGFFTILVLAGADKIPTDLYDAARLEGATQLQMFRRITLPMIWDVVSIALVLWAIQAIKLFEYPYAFGGPNIPQELYTPGIQLYILGFGQREPVYALGYATTIGMAMFLITVLFVVAMRRVFRTERLEY